MYKTTTIRRERNVQVEILLNSVSSLRFIFIFFFPLKIIFIRFFFSSSSSYFSSFFLFFRLHFLLNILRTTYIFQHRLSLYVPWIDSPSRQTTRILIMLGLPFNFFTTNDYYYYYCLVANYC